MSSNRLHILRGTLHANTALHIGSGSSNTVSDALLFRDAGGSPLIPGTAIAGALRETLTRLAPRLAGYETICKRLNPDADTTPCGCPVCLILGDVNPADDANQIAMASRVKFAHSHMITDQASQIRDSVGIDRVTGAAARAARSKFDVEVLSAGTCFSFELDLTRCPEDGKRLIAASLEEWRAGRLWLGANAARGLGAFSLEDLLSFERDLDDPDQLLAYLENDDPLDGVTGNPNWSTPIIAGIQTVSRPADDGSQHLAGHWAALTIDLQFNGPVISNHAGSALRSGFDAAPLLAADGDWDAPILSGAGLRGVIRSHAERLSRTWTTHQIQAEGPSFLERCPACDPLQSEPGQPLASCDSLLRKAGVLYDQEIAEERLCLACRLFGSTRRGSRLKISDAAFDEKNTVGKPSYKMLDFLAIDRFTGGGQDKLKFDALVLWKPAFTFKIFIEDPQDWELAWLALVLRDMQTQLVAIGSGASKGFGRLENLAVTATLGFLHDADLKGLGLPAEGQREAAVYTTQPFDLFAQDTWLKNWREHAAGLNRDVQTLPPLQTDSYFGTSPSLDVLYPLEVRDER